MSACFADPVLATDCKPLLEQFNQAIDTAQEAAAQALVDEIAGSADCGQFQTRAQQRLSALRLSAAQILMARGRPSAEYERLLTASETTEVLWQASATLGEVRFGERRFAQAAEAYDRAIDIVKNERLTPDQPEKFEIEGLLTRAAQARLLAANVKMADGTTQFVQTARDKRDGTLGGIYSRSVRGITPQAVPVPITFEYAKTTFTQIGEQAAPRTRRRAQRAAANANHPRRAHGYPWQRRNQFEAFGRPRGSSRRLSQERWGRHGDRNQRSRFKRAGQAPRLGGSQPG